MWGDRAVLVGRKITAGLILLGMLFVSMPRWPYDCSVANPVCDPFVVQGISTVSTDPSLSTSVLAEIEGGSIARAEGPASVIAVVDTGVDPAIVSKGAVLDWVDITGEGTVETLGPFPLNRQGVLHLDGREYVVSDIVSKSGQVLIGRWRSDTLPLESPLRELLGSAAEISILATDVYVKGQYDTVYIDTNGDDSFQGEKGLEVYRNVQEHASVQIPGTLRSLSVVLCDILDNGRTVVLGFDGNSHGTKIASIIGGEAREFTPVAPECKIISIKAIDSSGKTSWHRLSEGLRTACDLGAQIVVMGAAPTSKEKDDHELSQAIKGLTSRYGVLVVIAAGNNGPGLGTLPAYAGLGNVLAAGGYIPRALASGSSSQFWPWSSVGPTPDGCTVGVLAPALAPSLVPVWLAQTGAAVLFEGTSCSAAYAAGAAGLVATEMARAGHGFSAKLVKDALEEGALPLPGLQAVEQGKGLLQIRSSLNRVEALGYQSRIRCSPAWDGVFREGGFFDRKRVPGYIPVGLDNFTASRIQLSMSAPSWIRLESNRISIPAVEQRETFMRVDPNLGYGLWSGFVFGDDPTYYGRDLGFLVTAVVPRWFGEEGILTTQSLLSQGALHRDYIRVMPGQENLGISLVVNPGPDQKPRGRAKMFLYNGSGEKIFESGWLGRGAGEDCIDLAVRLPASGVWEVVVLADPECCLYGTDTLSFELSLRRDGVFGEEGLPYLQVVGGKTSETLETQISFYNPGRAFVCTPFVTCPGYNGSVVAERLSATSSASLIKPLPTVGAEARFLYLEVSNPDDHGAKIDVFLYHLDEGRGKWVEVASTRDSQHGVLAVKSPEPGQYVVYIDVGNLKDSSVSFDWISVLAEGRLGYDPSFGPEVTWAAGENTTFSVSIPASVASEGPSTGYLGLWDGQARRLKALFPFTASLQQPAPLVYVGLGALVDGGRVVTVSAKDPRNLKPIDALVCLDGTWHQLRNGRATVTIKRANLDGLVIVATYPGMQPTVKVISE